MKRLISSILAITSLGAARAADAPPPAITKTIPLPGVEGRFDHAAYDAKTHRLFFAALGNNTLEVVNVDSARRVHTIAGLKKPTGVLYLAEWNLIAVANGDDGTCRFFDGTSYHEKGRVKGVEDADNLRFDAAEKKIYLGYGEGALGIIDPAALTLTGSIVLTKHPESFQIESGTARIFVNVPDARQIAVVDRKLGKVSATWPLQEVSANFPMALDESHHCLFVGCRNPARLLAIDTGTGKRIAETPMGGDVDDLFFHPATARLFSSCGEGFLDSFQFKAPGSLERLQHTPTADGARTCFSFAPEDWLCLAVPHRGKQAAELRVFNLSAK
jgi:hypothetical protein